MKWTEEYRINSHDTDYNKIVSASGILRFMQDAANCQMENQKPSYIDLFTQGLAFVITRLNLSIYAPLRQHEIIQASSWACESKGVSFNRCYSISRGGVIVAEASSVWALIRMEDKRPIRVSDFNHNYDSYNMLELDMPARLKIPSDLNMSLVGVHTVKYMDVDLNKHINNTHYPDILCGYIPEMENNRVISLIMNFVSEAPLGEEIKIYCGVSDGIYYFRTMRQNGCTNIEAQIMLEEI